MNKISCLRSPEYSEVPNNVTVMYIIEIKGNQNPTYQDFFYYKVFIIENNQW